MSHLGDITMEAAHVEGEGVGEAGEDVLDRPSYETGDARFVLQEPALHVRAQGAGEGELGQEHEDRERALACVPVCMCVWGWEGK